MKRIISIVLIFVFITGMLYGCDVVSKKTESTPGASPAITTSSTMTETISEIPSSTPETSVEPTTTPGSTPSLTLNPSPSPAPTPTPSPVPTPSPTPTLSPSPTPSPIPTQTPTPTPVPSQTPEPSDQIEAGSRFYMGNGLYSVELRETRPAVVRADSLFSSEKFFFENYLVIESNYSQKSTYEATAKKSYNSAVSYWFSMFFDMETYSETEFVEETLPNGLFIRWQIMKDSKQTAIICEAFSDNFGYNFYISSLQCKLEDDELIGIIRSLECDIEYEEDRINCVQMRKENSVYVSIDRCFEMETGFLWEPATMIMKPESTYALVVGNGLCLIDMVIDSTPLYMRDLDFTYNKKLETLKSQINFSDTVWGDTEEIVLENLNATKAYVTEVFTGGSTKIYIKQLGFKYNGNVYIGRFMWIEELDEQYREEIENAIESISVYIPD